jgi:hypothetical protein
LALVILDKLNLKYSIVLKQLQMELLIIVILIIGAGKALFEFIKDNYFSPSQEQENQPYTSRRDYYRNVYLKSEAWRRKRFVVLRRDKWRCVYCGAKATQVHHTRYAKYNIGKEPIEWLVSVCKSCHDKQHE